MKSSYPSSYYKQDSIIANGTYVKVYSLGLGLGIYITWITNQAGAINAGTSASTIRLICQDGSAVDLLFRTVFSVGGSGNSGQKIILPLIVRSASVITNATSPGAS